MVVHCFTQDCELCITTSLQNLEESCVSIAVWSIRGGWCISLEASRQVPRGLWRTLRKPVHMLLDLTRYTESLYSLACLRARRSVSTLGMAAHGTFRGVETHHHESSTFRASTQLHYLSIAFPGIWVGWLRTGLFWQLYALTWLRFITNEASVTTRMGVPSPLFQTL